MTAPEELERERASDIPEGAEVRADGSYVTPPESLTEEQRAELLPPEQTEDEKARESAAEELQRERASDAPNVDDEDAERELAQLDSPPREMGTTVPQDGAQ